MVIVDVDFDGLRVGTGGPKSAGLAGSKDLRKFFMKL